MNIQRKNSAHHFRMQSEREQTLILFMGPKFTCTCLDLLLCNFQVNIRQCFTRVLVSL